MWFGFLRRRSTTLKPHVLPVDIQHVHDITDIHLVPTRARVTLLRAVIIASIISASMLHAGSAARAASVTEQQPRSASPSEFARGGAGARSGDPWQWSNEARSWARSTRVLPSRVLSRGPSGTVSRQEFVSALARIQDLRGPALTSVRPRRSLRDSNVAAPARPGAPAGSVAARAIALGWMPLRRGHFAGSEPVTSDEAAIALAGMLGLRGDVAQLTVRLRSEVPGSNVTLAQSAHALVRTLGLRYNVLDPNDEYELGPGESVNVAHGAYMLHVAGAKLDSWRLDDARELARTFDLPALTPAQNHLLAASVQLIGQPYVWAGETEGEQAEGHGGFDCSGFVIRVVNGSGLPEQSYSPILERTTYTQSDIAGSARITRDALQPGDVVFFGDQGPASSPGQNFHTGIYMGSGWFIHSSGGNGGVAIDALSGWWGDRYSWGRRVLTGA